MTHGLPQITPSVLRSLRWTPVERSLVKRESQVTITKIVKGKIKVKTYDLWQSDTHTWMSDGHGGWFRVCLRR